MKDGPPPAMAAAVLGESASPPLAQTTTPVAYEGPRFLKLKTIASGSFGSVAVHWDQLAERTVCIKRPRDEKAAASFIREIVTSAAWTVIPV